MLIRYCLCSIKFSSIDVIYKKKKFNNSKDFLSDSADRKSQAHSYLRVFNQVVDVTSSFVCGLCDRARDIFLKLLKLDTLYVMQSYLYTISDGKVSISI